MIAKNDLVQIQTGRLAGGVFRFVRLAVSAVDDSGGVFELVAVLTPLEPLAVDGVAITLSDTLEIRADKIKPFRL